MKNVLQMYKVRKKLEREPVCEDSKTRVYLSLVPSREYRIQRYRDTVRAVTEALRLFFGPVQTVAVQAAVIIGVTMVTYEIMHNQLAGIRNSGAAAGGEIFIAPAVGIIAVKAVRQWAKKQMKD